MIKPRVLVLRAAGINCDEETAFAWEMAGAAAERVHVKRLIEKPRTLRDYQVLTIPGGFSYGDDIASGKILGNQIMHHLGQELGEFVDRGGYVLGICNGFQVLVRAGLLPGGDCPVRATLTMNDSGRYEDRWVWLRAESSQCPFLEKGEMFTLPVAHAEGKLVIDRGPGGLSQLKEAGRIALTYGSNGRSTQSAESNACRELPYPENPNGSIGNGAGLVDRTGRILGLMPHPERAMSASQFPDHLRDASAETGGLKLFKRAIRYLTE